MKVRIASKNKELNQIKKARKETSNKKELWSKLQELNNNFAKMKKHKKLNNKKKFNCILNICFYYLSIVNKC